MSDLLIVVKPKSTAPAITSGGDIAMIIRPKAVTPVVKDDDDGGDMTDSIMPLCPKCSKSDDVMSIDAHPDMGGDDEGDTVPSSDGDDDTGDGYCCTTCAYVWPGDASTPQETPARPAKDEEVKNWSDDAREASIEARQASLRAHTAGTASGEKAPGAAGKAAETATTSDAHAAAATYHGKMADKLAASKPSVSSAHAEAWSAHERAAKMGSKSIDATTKTPKTPARPKAIDVAAITKSLIDGGMGVIKAKEMAEAADTCDRANWICQSFVRLMSGRDKMTDAVNAVAEFLSIAYVCSALLSKGNDGAIAQCLLAATSGRKAVSLIQAILPLIVGDAVANSVASRAILAISASADCCEEVQPDA